MVIRILDHVPTASTYEDGEVIYRLLRERLDKGEAATISFEGIPSVSSAFVNSAFIRLLETLPFDRIRSNLRIVNSTKYINDLIRSRFEFATKPGSVRDGIYHVAFSAAGQQAGAGLVVIKDGSVNGGDTGYLFTGSMTKTGSSLTADIHVQQWNPGHPSIFGSLFDFSLTLTGRGDDGTGTFRLEGYVVGQPQLRIAIAGRYLAPCA